MNPGQMYIADIIFCQNAFPDQHGSITIQGPLPGYLVLPQVPSRKHPVTYSFQMVMTFYAKEEMPETEVKFTVTSQSGMVIVNNSWNLGRDTTRQEHVTKNTDGLLSGGINLDLRNFPFIELGEYRFRVETPHQSVEKSLYVTAVLVDDADTTSAE
ncbi:hypothetical protein [Alicyclobacillus sendaiensis]|uniref:hypothetical protein n=1 Tax=Alicyclobacillus sendaiensis TaxID=192387 RepID=UPI0026F44B32|nr:hypothetical protein [Alicyclobacillus sendaiensis]